MKKKLYKIKIWLLGDCDLLQETDRYLNEDEANNFKVAKQHRGTIEEVKKRDTTESTKTTQVLGQTLIEQKV
jgi:hypothetical protein|tara:strand:+ start:198 stop:413 length:216 start_codon:yes stop_codon:yes gene_type:complete